MRSRKAITVKVQFEGGDVLFGNSYRTWDDQLEEFCARRLDGDKYAIPVSITMSDSPWVSFGGLKWCSPENFQKELDREGAGRKVEDFVFSFPTESVLKMFNAIREQAIVRENKRTTVVSQ